MIVFSFEKFYNKRKTNNENINKLLRETFEKFDKQELIYLESNNRREEGYYLKHEIKKYKQPKTLKVDKEFIGAI